MNLTVPIACRLLTTHFIAKLISLSPLYCFSEIVFVNRLHLINSNMNVVYVWLAGWLPETPCLKALSVLSSRCTLRPPVCLPGWPTLASTICAVLNTFCHCHTAHWWSLSDSMSRSLHLSIALMHLELNFADISSILSSISSSAETEDTDYLFIYFGIMFTRTAFLWKPISKNSCSRL